MGTVNNNLYTESVVIIPPPPPRFTLNEWYLNNRQKYRGIIDQQQLADKILAECKRCYDDVERELKKECEMIESGQNLLRRTLEQANEQVRRLRATTYLMDRDLEDKSNVLKIDGQNLTINENSFNLSTYHGFAPLDPANVTAEEWEAFTMGNILKCGQEISSARSLRVYTDILLKQVMEDLTSQYHTVNDAFRRRIEETKEAKAKLEANHSEIARQANEMTRNIVNIKKAFAESEGFMALAHTRLGNRCQRPGMELCKDLVETGLVNEVREIRENCDNLQLTLTEAQASLRYLLKTQVDIEEDLNVKTNTLKIDEVDCMTLRQSMDYHAY
ncbi:hypothetical protein FQR65_LT06226 [Abscondita terminalis]|nr:hypothetical protein FQR65_LT06226 [Abscondita terminalis]